MSKTLLLMLYLYKKGSTKVLPKYYATLFAFEVLIALFNTLFPLVLT
jgi:hypothetical protein